VGPAIGYIAVVALGEAARSHRAATEARVDAVRREAELEARGRLLEQRVELAREVHDVLAHTVTVIAVQAAAAEEALDRRPAETRAALATMRATAREALAELRGAVALLRGGVEPVPESPGIAGVARLCEQAGSAGTAVTLTAPGTSSEGALPGVVDRAVYRIVQEALTNTVRHAAAGSASVLIDLGDGEVRVEVVDDGVGARCVVEGHGLRGMRERAQALGGTLDAGPAPGRGFRVAATLPVGARP
jgi:signal transduction histidine kinase